MHWKQTVVLVQAPQFASQAWHGFVTLNCPLLELQLTVVISVVPYPGAHVRVHCATVFAVDAASQVAVL
jgi:hypothetical protein